MKRMHFLKGKKNSKSMKKSLSEDIKDNNNREVMNFKHKSKPQRLQEMLSSINLLRKKQEEELNMSNLRTSEMNYKSKSKRKEQELLNVMKLRRD